MSKRMIFLLWIGICLAVPAKLWAGKALLETKVPASLTPALKHLMEMVEPGQKTDFKPELMDALLTFVQSSKKDTALYYSDIKSHQTSAYYEFELESSLARLLQLAYNFKLPGVAFRPASVRLSRWEKDDGMQSEPLPELWQLLPELSQRPVIIRGKEYEMTTPDLSTGGYYGYNLIRTLLLFKHKGSNIFISLSKQIDKSDVGKKGLILGKDEDWTYFYSGEKGLSRPGLGWTASYIYSSFSISILIEAEPGRPLIKYGIFKWLHAGWMGINFVKHKDIYQGMRRYAGAFKSSLECPGLPAPAEMISRLFHIKNMPLDRLKAQVKAYFADLAQKHGTKEVFGGDRLADFLKKSNYLERMTTEEMYSLIIVEYMKLLLGKTQASESKSLLSLFKPFIPITQN
jgi:hypothetical protein